MEELNVLDEEYLNHEVPKEILPKIVNPYVLLLNIDDVVDELQKNESRYYRRLMKNGLHQRLNGLYEKLFNDSYMDDALELREKYLLDQVGFIDDTILFCSRIVEVIDEKNYLELARLFDFMTMHFASSMQAKETKLDGIDYALKGEGFIDNRFKDTSTELRVFMNKQLNGYEKQKQLEKKI